MQRIILSLFCLIVSLTAQASTINIACTYPAITNALLTTAQEGDTVVIGAGTCTISNLIVVNRSISFNISGSGTNSTTLQSIGSMGSGMLLIQSSSTNLFSIHDMNIVGASGDGYALVVGNSGTDFNGPFRVYNIQMTNVVGRGIAAGAGRSHNSYGLIDHCYLVAGTGYAQMFDPEGAVYGSWTNSNPIGTTNVLCIEDCHLVTQSGNAGNGYFDSYNGAQLVFRHNLCDGYSPIGGHGYDSGDSSIRTWEVYNNVFTNWDNSLALAIWRGGGGVMFSNAVYGAALDLFAGISYYRSCPYLHPYGSFTGYLLTGQTGTNYTVNFAGVTNYQTGCGATLSGQPSNTQELDLGFTHYFFVSSLANATFNMANVSGFGGGAVLIGASVAETITNLYNAINVGPGYGVTRTNAFALPFTVGHDYIAIALNSTNLYLTNALDGTNGFGYPANQQEGVIQSFPLTSTNFINNQVVWGCYGWSNTFNGNNMATFDAGTNVSQCNYNITNLVRSGRDYFNDVIPSPGYYTALVYPHPLAGGGGGGGGGSSSGTISLRGTATMRGVFRSQ